MTYPYDSRDLFETPEFYHYAPCASPGFLDAWRSSRQRVMDELPGLRTQPAEPVAQSLSDEVAEPGSVAAGLAACIREMQSAKVDWPATHAFLARLVHRFEVSRRLDRRYAADGKRLPGAGPAALGTYLLFGLALAAAYRGAATTDLQKASTLVKLCDALASKGARAYDGEAAAALRLLLDFEREIVDGFSRGS